MPPESGDIQPPSPDAGGPEGLNWQESGHGQKSAGSDLIWTDSAESSQNGRDQAGIRSCWPDPAQHACRNLTTATGRCRILATITFSPFIIFSCVPNAEKYFQEFFFFFFWKRFRQKYFTTEIILHRNKWNKNFIFRQYESPWTYNYNMPRTEEGIKWESYLLREICWSLSQGPLFLGVFRTCMDGRLACMRYVIIYIYSNLLLKILIKNIFK